CCSVSTSAAEYPRFCLHQPTLVPCQLNHLFLLIHSTAQFTVTGPDHPITVPVGGEAVLPCHLSPRTSAQDMELRWFRLKFSAVVHQYAKGQDQYDGQMLEYHGRTELLKDDITNGNVSLRLRPVRPSDHGQYTCLFQSRVFYEEAFLELMVSGPFLYHVPSKL
uniref:Ig-like domain-containing protein n=1 Tax=Pelodiscus sinensis TaxID=13735 RepID=K7FFM4_PELSI